MPFAEQAVQPLKAISDLFLGGTDASQLRHRSIKQALQIDDIGYSLNGQDMCQHGNDFNMAIGQRFYDDLGVRFINLVEWISAGELISVRG